MSESITRTSVSPRLVEQIVSGGLIDSDLLLDEDALPESPEGFTLDRLIGRGGCGVVYLARDLSLDRPVAIKLLHEAGSADIERFRREARFTARLDNPSIVKIYGFGEAHGRAYITMQYVDGPNLADATLDPRGVLHVMRRVADALRHAHAEGIVHRDIKPENILIGGDEHVYLTDFGIARSLRGSPGDTISREGQIVGTPGLMPPEQARGEIHAVDARSDVYAVGATLYAKLTGRYPFRGDSIVDVLHAVIHDTAPLPRSINADIPRVVESLIVRCMAKRREDRYQRIDEVLAAIDGFLGGGDIGYAAAWMRGMIADRPETPEQPDVETDDRSLTEGLDLVRTISAWDADLYRVSGSLTRSFERLDGVRERLDAILRERPDTAWARFYRGVVHFRRGRLSAALEDMERAIDRVSDLAGASFELGRVYLARYLREQHLARKHITRMGVEHALKDARRRLEQAVVMFEEAARMPGDVAPWRGAHARAVQRLAEDDFAGCVAACDAILDGEPDVEEVWKLRGDALALSGDDPFESYDRAVQVRRSYFEAHYARAEAWLARNRPDEARDALQEACRIHPEFVDALTLLARTCLYESDNGGDGSTLAEGLQLAERAYALDGESYDNAVTLAEVLTAAGRRGDEAALIRAEGVLAAAGVLEGCQNRVNLLAARAALERARLARRIDGDPAPHLDRAATLYRGRVSAVEIPLETVWVEFASELNKETAS